MKRERQKKEEGKGNEKEQTFSLQSLTTGSSFYRSDAALNPKYLAVCTRHLPNKPQLFDKSRPTSRYLVTASQNCDKGNGGTHASPQCRSEIYLPVGKSISINMTIIEQRQLFSQLSQFPSQVFCWHFYLQSLTNVPIA